MVRGAMQSDRPAYSSTSVCVLVGETVCSQAVFFCADRLPRKEDIACLFFAYGLLSALLSIDQERL